MITDEPNPRLHTIYYAIRVVRPPRKGMRIERWLFARIKGAPSHHWRGKFYEKDRWQRSEWLLGESPTWFETMVAARRRLRTKAVKEKVGRGWRAEIVKVRLIAHTDVAWTNAEDVVSKLACLAVEES